MKSKLLKAIDKQINSEFYNSFLYLSMAVWAESEDWAGFAHWMRLQAQEEYIHATTLINQVLERGEKPTLMAIKATPTSWDSLQKMMEDTLVAEQETTKCIDEIADLALELKDHAFYEFILMYVKEQVEEEDSAQKILTQVTRIGDNIGLLYQLDNVLSQRAYETPFPEVNGADEA